MMPEERAAAVFVPLLYKTLLCFFTDFDVLVSLPSMDFFLVTFAGLNKSREKPEVP